MRLKQARLHSRLPSTGAPSAMIVDMSRSAGRKCSYTGIGNISLARSQRKPVPYEFVLEALDALSPRTRPMFGCFAVYIEEKIVLILRDKPTSPADNGVWLATSREHHESLRGEFPSMRSIGVLGKLVTGWQLLPADSGDFEEAALRACDLISARDLRIGKVPKRRRARRLSSGAVRN